MTRTVSALLMALFLMLSLTACGDGDDPAATTAAAPSTATSTTPGGAPTATSDADADASPNTSSFTDEEAALLDLLLAESDLRGDWTQLRVEAPEISDSPGICDAPPFPRASERIAEVEVEYQSADGARFVLQDLTEFPEEVAVEAMNYIRETATCSEWTDETGTTFQISQTEAPDVGDESHALHVAFQVADAGTLEGDFIFVRVGGYVTIVTSLELGSYDRNFSSEVATIAAGKIAALTGADIEPTDQETELTERLLTLDAFGDEWEQLQPAHPSEPENWTGICDAELYPESEQATARVAVEFYEGRGATSASLMQLLVSYPPDLAAAAFAYEREAASCESFTSGDTQVTVEQAASFPALGDESFAVRFTLDTGEETAEGYWIVIRAGEALTTLIYTDPTEIDQAAVESIAQTAASNIATP